MQLRMSSGSCTAIDNTIFDALASEGLTCEGGLDLAAAIGCNGSGSGFGNGLILGGVAAAIGIGQGNSSGLGSIATLCVRKQSK